MFEIEVPLPERSYRIMVGQGEASRNVALKQLLDESTKVFLISNRRIWKLYGRQFRAASHVAAGAVALLIPDGERHKNIRWYSSLCRDIVKRGADRQSTILALGGGVVGDLAGFVAGTVLRGLRVVQMPTTLLAQIDSSIGGKTAINLPEGKNLVGAFHQPSLVVVDPLFLRTLPRRELRAGLYEAIKYGVVLNPSLFEILEARLAALLECDLDAIEEVIRECATSKAEIVAADERESGKRKLLNFGHTVGHALESATAYRRFKHGEAVGWGSLVALRMAEKLSLLSRSEAGRMMACIRSVGSLPTISDIPVSAVLSHMQHDKKAAAGKLQFILPTGVGSGKVVGGVDIRLIREAYRAIQKESRQATRGGRRSARRRKF